LPLLGFPGGRRFSAVLPGRWMADACVACCLTIAVLGVLPFRLIFREKK